MNTLKIRVSPKVLIPPIVDVGPDIGVQLPTTPIIINASVTDEGTIVQYLWEELSGNSNFTTAGTNQQSISISNLAAGSYTFRLTVTDDDGLTGSDTLTITVAAANRPPIANAGIDQAGIFPITSITLDGSLSIDPDGDTITYLWEALNGGSISDPTAVNPVVTNIPSAGIYDFRLTVTDPDGLTDTDIIRLTVTNTTTTGISILEGECGAITFPPVRTDVFVQTSALPDLDVGDVLYTNDIATNTFNGLGQTFIYITDSGDSREIIVSSTGIITSIRTCPSTPTGGSGIISTDSKVVNDCFSRAVVTVRVPAGETIFVRITATGQGATPNLTQTITSDRTYTLDVDGASSGSNSFTGSVNMTTQLDNSSGVVRGTVSLVRSHSGVNC